MSTKKTAKRLKAIGSAPVAVNELVNQRKSDYAEKKRKAAADNRKAQLKAAGTVVHEGLVLSPRVTAMLAAARSPAPISPKAELHRVAMDVRSMLISLIVDLNKYSDDDAGEIREISIHLDRARSAMLDLPRVNRERRIATIMAGA